MSDRLEGWGVPIDQTVDGYYILDHSFVRAPNGWVCTPMESNPLTKKR